MWLPRRRRRDGSTFAGFAYFGNYTSRIDGPGKVFDFQRISGITIENIWAEHMVCLYWGADTDRMTIRNNRIRNTFADGLNMTNGSSDNLVANNEARATGDDSFALFSALDSGGGEQTHNVYENLTSKLTWRAAGLAVYGGSSTPSATSASWTPGVLRGDHLLAGLRHSDERLRARPDHVREPRHRARGRPLLERPDLPRHLALLGVEALPGDPGERRHDHDPTYHGIMFQTNYVGQQPQNPVQDTELSDVTVSGAKKSGDEYNDRSGFGIWANEAAGGPAVGQAAFHRLTLRDNAQNIRNTTSTFKITVD